MNFQNRFIGILLIGFSVLFYGCNGSSTDYKEVNNDNSNNNREDLINNTVGTFENNASLDVGYRQEDNMNVLYILWRRTGKYINSIDNRKETFLMVSDNAKEELYAIVRKRSDEGVDVNNYPGDKEVAYMTFTMGEYSDNKQKFYLHTIRNCKEGVSFFFVSDSTPTYLAEGGVDIDGNDTVLYLGEFNMDANGVVKFTKYDN